MKEYNAREFVVYSDGVNIAVANKFAEMATEFAKDGWELMKFESKIEVCPPDTVVGEMPVKFKTIYNTFWSRDVKPVKAVKTTKKK